MKWPFKKKEIKKVETSKEDPNKIAFELLMNNAKLIEQIQKVQQDAK